MHEFRVKGGDGGGNFMNGKFNIFGINGFFPL
jgi:hypothetical protein